MWGSKVVFTLYSLEQSARVAILQSSGAPLPNAERQGIDRVVVAGHASTQAPSTKTLGG